MDLQTSPASPLLGVIGAGNLAGAVIRGLLGAKFCASDAIIASQPDAALRESFARETGVTVVADNAEVARRADVIFVGVKPSVVLPVLREIGDLLVGKLVVSLAAGVRIASMEALSAARFLRVMTNLPAAIGEGATAFARGSRTTENDAAKVRALFSAIGVLVEVEEAQIDAVTALGGSGPAFVYSVIEAFADGGVAEGLSPEVALALAAQMMRGAARLVSTSGKTPEELRRMVVTPGGTTAAGLAVFGRENTARDLADAIRAAAARGREMASESSS